MDDALDLVEEVHVVAGRDLAVLRPRDAEALIDEEDFDEREFLPYWAELWPSGQALAEAVGCRALGGMRVVELGCGLGLPSLAAALAGARVLATDWSQTALDLLHDNAERNGTRVETALVDWADPRALLEQAPFDLVLAADVVYEERAVEPLARLLPRLGREILLADPGRRHLEDLLERTGTTFRRPPLYGIPPAA